MRTTLLVVLLVALVAVCHGMSADHVRQLREKFQASGFAKLADAQELWADLQESVSGDSDADIATEAEVQVDAAAMTEAIARMESLQELANKVNFETIEHKRIGDAVDIPFVEDTDKVVLKRTTYTNNYKNSVSYGDAIAMAGDFYGVPAKLDITYAELRASQSVICYGKTAKDRRVNFLKAFESLYNGQTYAERLKTNTQAGDGWDVVQKYMKKEGDYLDYVTGQALSIPDKSAAELQAIKARLDSINKGSASDGPLAAERKASLRLNEVDEVKNTADLLNKFGFAMKLLNVNVDHFNGDQCAMYAYYAGHQSAMRYATKAGLAADLINQRRLMTIAVLMNGYADHFLTDSFCAGHFRGHRSHLLKRCEKKNLGFATKFFSPLLSAGLAANLMHDLDNFNGVEVLSLNDVNYVKRLGKTNEREVAALYYKQKFTIYGDFRLFDGPSKIQGGAVLTHNIDPAGTPSAFTVTNVKEQVQFERLKAAVSASVGDIKWAFENAVKARKANQGPVALGASVTLGASASYHAPDLIASTTYIPFYYARNPCPLFAFRNAANQDLSGRFTALEDPAKALRLLDKSGLVFWSTPISKECQQLAYMPDSWAKASDALWAKCKGESSLNYRCQYREFVDTDCPENRYEPDYKNPVTIVVPHPTAGQPALATRRLVNFKPPAGSSLSFSTAYNGLVGQYKANYAGIDARPGVMDKTFSDTD